MDADNTPQDEAQDRAADEQATDQVPAIPPLAQEGGEEDLLGSHGGTLGSGIEEGVGTRQDHGVRS